MILISITPKIPAIDIPNIPIMYSIKPALFSLSNSMSVVESFTWRVLISLAASSSRSASLSGFPSCTDFRVWMFLLICARVLSL